MWMRRREFLGLVGGGATAAWSFAASAQPAVPTIGFLSGRSTKSDASLVSAFLGGLRDTGFIDSRQFAIEYRWADGQQDRLPQLATNLVSEHVAIIIAADSASAIAAARVATATPIVFFSGGDPVKLGLVASFNQPGGVISGVTLLGHSITAKRLEVLHELVPNRALIAYLCAVNNPSAAEETAEVTAAAHKVGQLIQVFNVRDDGELAGKFDEIVRARANALLFGAGPVFTNNRQKIVDLAARYGIPAFFSLREFVDTGGLASYGADLRDGFVQMGHYAGRILKGEKASDLPVMQPTKFELVINLKTAKALGLTVAPALLARADEVIE